MKYQIEQLALRAGFNLHNDIIDGHNFNHELEKFAQLIVKKCVDIVSDTAVNTPPNDLFYGYNLGVNKAAENIKERFGV